MIKLFSHARDAQGSSKDASTPQPVNAAPPQDGSALAKLLTEYRALSRSSELMPKITLLRKIVKLSPEPTAHVKLLEEFESQQMAILTDEAKDAICNRDFARLSQLQQDMEGPEWRIKPRDVVSAKIHRVLEEVKSEHTEKIAVKLLDSLNEAYGNFDLEQLEKAQKEWKDFLRKSNYTVTKEQMAQAQEAEEYLLQEQKKINAENLFHKSIELFKQELERDTPVEQLDKLYAHITMTGRELPPAVLACYQQYHETADSIQKRKKLLRTIKNIFAILILVGIIGGIVTFILMRKQEADWCARLEDSLDNAPISVTKLLLEDLQKLAPYLNNRPKIKFLKAQIQEKDDAEQKQKQLFQTLLEKIKRNLNDYSANRDSLVQLMGQARTCIADAQDEAEYLKVSQELQTKRVEFRRQQSSKCLELQEKITELKKQFDASLAQCDFQKAGEAVAKMETYRNHIITMPEVEEEMRSLCLADLKNLDSLPQAIEKQQEMLLDMQRALSDLKEVKTMKELEEATVSFLQHFPQSPHAGEMKQLKTNLEQARGFILGEGPNSLYAQEREWMLDRVGNLDMACQEIMVLARKEQLRYQEQPIYSVMLKSQDGQFYDLYFTNFKSFKPVRARSDSRGRTIRRYSFQVLTNEYMETTTALLEFLPQKQNAHPNTTTLRIDTKPDPTVIRGTLVQPNLNDLVSPKPMDFKLAWITSYKDLEQKLMTLAQEDKHLEQESVIVNFLNRLLADPIINPTIKMAKVLQILKIIEPKLDVGEAYGHYIRRMQALSDQIPKDYQWLKSYQPDQQKIRTSLNQRIKLLGAVPDTLAQKNAFKMYMTLTNLDRQIAPAGFVLKNGNTVRLQGLLANQGKEGELWNYSATAPHWHIIGKFSGEILQVAPELKDRLQNMQLLFTPLAKPDSDAVNDSIKDFATQKGVESIAYPDTWPVKP